MSKRKKLRTSGEELRPPKPPKNPRLGQPKGGPQSSGVGRLHHPEESEDGAGPVAFTELSGQEPRGASSSSPHAESGAASSLLRQPEEEPAALPPSQNSVGRFVPQFAKPKKMGTRRTETREEDPENGAVSLDALPEPGAQQAGSQLLQESLGPALQEARGPVEQMRTGGPRSEQSGQNLATPEPGRGDSQPPLSPQAGTEPSRSETASQDRLPEPRGSTSGGGSLEDSGPETEGAWVLGDPGLKGHLPSSDTGGRGPDRGAPREGGAQGGARAELPGAPQDRGASSPCTAAPGASGLAQQLGPASPHLKTSGVAQAPPDPRQLSGGTGGEAAQSCSSPGGTSLGAVVFADKSADPTETEQRAPAVARPGGQASPSRQAPGRGRSGAELACAPPAGPTAGLEGGTQGDSPWSPLALLGPASGDPTLTADAEDSGPLALGGGSAAGRAQGPSRDQEEPGRTCTQPADRQAAASGSQGREQVLEVLHLSLRGASGGLEPRDTVDGLPQATSAPPGSPDTSADPPGQPQRPPSSSELEPDFLPDSQLRDALEGPDLEAPPEQLPPAWSDWRPGASPRARAGLVVGAQVQPRPSVEVQAREAPRMEDATGTVRGLVVELSNLNRLVMSVHRDLDAFKRLHSRKAPLQYPAKAQLPRWEQAWRDL